MKSMILPLSSAILAAGLCVYGCYRFGMPREDLRIAALVAGGVALSTAVGAVLLARPRRQSR